ncbi:MAG: hypothetical protein JWM71_57 [Solirubrobacteraceae bacterium]|nr:hypothetical protein [Solirubrobacteraceae bacterium]
MRALPLALLAVLAGVPAATAGAAKLPNDLSVPDTYDCRQTFANYGPTGIPSWVVADRGRLTFHVGSSSGKPTSYDFDAPWLTTEARAGGWSWKGTVVAFDSGPLAMQSEGWPTIEGSWYQGRRTLPHDDVPGRTEPLVLRSDADGSESITMAPAVKGHEGKDGHQSSYWYCGPHGVAPRKLLAGSIGRVQRVSGLKVRLPTWFETGDQGTVRTVRGRVRVVQKGLYRVQLVEPGCKNCGAIGIFSAMRAPASRLGHRTPVALPGGVRGYVGGVGCGPHGANDWGPVYCGRNVIVWHAAGVNYAIETPFADDADLVRLANQVVRYG